MRRRAAPGCRTALAYGTSPIPAALEIDPEFCQPHYWLGRVHLEAKDFNQAIPRFQRALECREQSHDRFAREALEAIFLEFKRHHCEKARARLALNLASTPPPIATPHHHQPDTLSNLGNI